MARALSERFWEKVDRRGADECWPWLAAMHYKGYGEFRVAGDKDKAHRVAYELEVGPIPDGMVIDHTCHNADPDCNGGDKCPHRRCCNPAHLDPTTSEENRSRSHRAHCPRGHRYEGDNILLDGSGAYLCRTCVRARSKKQRAEESRTCTWADCKRPLAWGGLCAMHVTRERRGHDMDAPPRKNYLKMGA